MRCKKQTDFLETQNVLLSKLVFSFVVRGVFSQYSDYQSRKFGTDLVRHNAKNLLQYVGWQL